MANTSILYRSEHREQVEFVSWWRKRRTELIMSVPNGEKRSKAAAAKVKAEGQLKGAMDIFIPECATWIEFKRQDQGSLSKEQREFGKRMLAAGYRVIVAWGCADAIEQVENGERDSWKRPK